MDGRLILSPRTEIFSGKRDFLKGRPKFPNGISEWKMCVPCVPGLLASIAFDPMFQEKVVEMERAHPRGNSQPFGICRFPFTTTVDQPVFPNKWKTTVIFTTRARI